MPLSIDDAKMSFMEHLGELRVRIVRALIGLLIGTVIVLPFSQYIVDWLAKPVTKLNYTLVFTAPAEAFWVQMKVGLIVGIFLSAPVILWQVWAFIAPGLHGHEKKYALPFVIIGSLLFVGGGAFSLFVVTPYAIQFLLSYARPGLQPMITLQNHVDFLLKFTLAFGAVFELPLALTILARVGVVNAKMLARNRKYAILGAFIAGAVLTPTPDAFNQALMAGPLIILYVGDFDPSGMCMSERDIPERLARYGGDHITIKRIALLRSDCTLLGRRPAFNVSEKKKDPRAPWFRKTYGQLCWELDAMDPNDLRSRVEQEIKKHIEPVAWERCRVVDLAERESMGQFLDTWKG